MKKYVKLCQRSPCLYRELNFCTFKTFPHNFILLSHKFSVWAWNLWNPCDGAAILFFWIGLSLRLQTNSQDVGRVIYCVDSIYWYLRILNILGVNKYLGKFRKLLGAFDGWCGKIMKIMINSRPVPYDDKVGERKNNMNKLLMFFSFYHKSVFKIKCKKN